MSAQQSFRLIKTVIEDGPIWRRLTRNTSISMAGSGLILAIKLGQTALLTRVLSIDDYGRLLIVLNLFIFLESFFGLRASDVIFRFFRPLEERQDIRALKGLLLLCLGVGLVSGVAIYGGVALLSPWLTERLYPGLELAPLFNIYGCTVLVTAFSGVYEPILRLHDRFISIVASQVVGSVVTLFILCAYFATNMTTLVSTGNNSNLKIAIVAFTVGALVQSLPPFVQALRLVKPFFSGVKAKEALQALAVYRRELAGCFVNSNLSGYLRFAISPGDVFLLGLFSTPTQLAFYGVARQLTAPLALLQTNIQTAITPEIVSLAAKGKFEQLKRLLARYLWWTFGFGALLLIGITAVGRFLILNFLPPEYSAALPVFYLLSFATWLILVFLVFRPVAISLDLLKWHTLVLLASAVIVVIFILAGSLNAMTMALIQVAEVLLLRSFFNALVWSRLKQQTSQG